LAFPEIWSEFALLGERLDPPLVTRRLALTPSRAFRADDPIVAEKGKRRTNGWVLSIGPERSFAVDEQVERLIAQLKPKTAEIVGLREELGVQLRIYCVVYMADQTPNIWFKPDVVAWASQIGASIDVDLYIANEAVLRPPVRFSDSAPN
jgi:hypothetical protein